MAIGMKKEKKKELNLKHCHVQDVRVRWSLGHFLAEGHSLVKNGKNAISANKGLPRRRRKKIFAIVYVFNASFYSVK